MISLGLNEGRKLAVPGSAAEISAVPDDRVLSLDEAIRQLEESEPGLAEPCTAPAAASVRSAVPEDVAEAVVYWLTRYSGNQSEAVRNIRELAARAPEQVVETVLPLCEEGRWGDAGRFLATLLTNDAATSARLCDPAASLERSVCVAKALAQHEPRFDARFAKSLLDDDEMTEAARHRGLAVLEKLGGGGRLVPILMQFLRDPDSRIRSKAALMFGKTMSSQGIMDRLLADQDARVRANFVEGLWHSTDKDACRSLFRRALEDPHGRVVGNALVGLYRLGESRDVIKHLGKMVRHPKAPFRATAAWVMGQTGEPIYTRILRHLVRDPDWLVRRNALRSLRRINTANSIAEKPPDD